MDVLQRSGRHVQPFLSQARFVSPTGACAITGEPNRHLDTWLMTPDTCRAVFVHGMRSADVGIVEGRYPIGPVADRSVGGRLDTVSEWLDLPRLVVLDVSQIHDCVAPPRLEKVDGLLLDRVADNCDLPRLRTMLEPLWGAPVLGALGEAAPLRAVVDHLPPGASPSRKLCQALGDQLAPSLWLDRLLQIAGNRAVLPADDPLFWPGSPISRLNVAVAYDEAFHCYFPDALDLLELSGATIRDFSPLRDERLPGDPDLVLIGCGRPEQAARELASNHCMLMDLRRYAGSGGRMYAEGGGMAYLCRQLVADDGRHYPMAGILPAVARHHSTPAAFEPVKLTLAENNWLGETTQRMRGYVNAAWQIEPAGSLVRCAFQRESRFDLVRRRQVIGSRLHLNFVAHPAFLQSLFRCRQPRRVVV